MLPPISAEVLAGVPCRVEVRYSDVMDARVHEVGADGRLSEVRDVSTGDHESVCCGPLFGQTLLY